MDSMEEKVRLLISGRLNIESGRIQPRTRFMEELGIDSVGKFELVLMLEEEFEVDIADEDAKKIDSLEDVLDCLKVITRRSGDRL